MESLGFTAIPAITVICYLVAQVKSGNPSLEICPLSAVWQVRCWVLQQCRSCGVRRERPDYGGCHRHCVRSGYRCTSDYEDLSQK